MLVKTEPKVYVIGVPHFQTEELERFLADQDLSRNRYEAMTGTDAERIVEMATRLCYQSFKKGRDTEAFFDNIISSGHGSTIEHANFTVFLTGVSRSFTHELVRHRAGTAFSQLSQRYVDASLSAVVMPPRIQALAEEHQRAWVSHMQRCLDVYKLYTTILDERGTERATTERRKRARETARSVLPEAMEVYMAMTGNARAWRHIFEMRTAMSAETEMRVVALACYKALRDHAPNLFGDYELNDTGELITPHRKI
jgi:thymidylate synthase (FAD)